MSIKVVLCILSVVRLGHGTGNSVCPESKKQYPRDCRLFYKCVPLFGSAQAYVWVPARCTAGLVYDPERKSCVESTVSCLTQFESDDTISESFYNNENRLEEMRQDSVPLSAVNTPFVDSIGNQMQRIHQIISTFKQGFTPSPVLVQKLTPVHYTVSSAGLSNLKKKPTPQIDLNLFGDQMNRLTLQLQENQRYPSTEFLVASLFRKYLSNGDFLSGGEYVQNCGEKLRDFSNCRRFLACNEQGTMQSYACPPHTAFSYRKRMCDANEYQKCDNGNSDRTVIKKNDAECENPGRFADPTSKRHYVICVFQLPVGWKKRRMACPGGAKFCEKNQSCLSNGCDE